MRRARKTARKPVSQRLRKGGRRERFSALESRWPARGCEEKRGWSQLAGGSAVPGGNPLSLECRCPLTVDRSRPQGRGDWHEVAQPEARHSEPEEELLALFPGGPLTCRRPEASWSRRWSAWPAAKRSRASGWDVENWSSKSTLVRAVGTGTSRWFSPKKEAGERGSCGQGQAPARRRLGMAETDSWAAGGASTPTRPIALCGTV